MSFCVMPDCGAIYERHYMRAWRQRVISLLIYAMPPSPIIQVRRQPALCARCYGYARLVDDADAATRRCRAIRQRRRAR